MNPNRFSRYARMHPLIVAVIVMIGVALFLEAVLLLRYLREVNQQEASSYSDRHAPILTEPAYQNGLSNKQDAYLPLVPAEQIPSGPVDIAQVLQRFSIYTLGTETDQTSLDKYFPSFEANSSEATPLIADSRKLYLPFPAVIDVKPSPDETYVAITEIPPKNEAQNQIWIVDLNSGNYRHFPPLGESVVIDKFIGWLPDSVHSVVRSTERKLWVINVQTGESREILFQGNIINAIVSPDGTHLVIVVYYGTGLGGELWLTDLYGGNPRLLFKDAGKTLMSPTWSSDGQFIAFYKSEDVYPRETELWVMMSDGTNARSFGPAIAGLGFRPVWNPRLSLVANVTPEHSVPSKTADTQSETREEIHSVHSDILIADPISGETITISAGTIDIDPAWSPDGSVLAFVSSTGSVEQLWVTDLAGHAQQVTSNTTAKRFPFWQRIQ